VTPESGVYVVATAPFSERAAPRNGAWIIFAHAPILGYRLPPRYLHILNKEP